MRKWSAIFWLALTVICFSATDVRAANINYTVKAGDNLWNIANTYKTNVDQLKKLNNLNNDKLKIGQSLIISQSAVAPAPAPTAPVPSSTPVKSSDGLYQVQPGDTMSGIAQAFGITVQQLKQLNSRSSDSLTAGETIMVGGGNPAATAPAPAPSRSGESLNNAALLLQKASSYLGTPYRYGGSSPGGFDCSGFVRFIFAQFGYNLPHNAASQSNLGQAVSKDNLLPGDLVFFRCGGSYIDHVGIYCGNNQFIHSSSPRSGGVIYSSLSNGYYSTYYHSATRILN